MVIKPKVLTSAAVAPTLASDSLGHHCECNSSFCLQIDANWYQSVLEICIPFDCHEYFLHWLATHMNTHTHMQRGTLVHTRAHLARSHWQLDPKNREGPLSKQKAFARATPRTHLMLLAACGAHSSHLPCGCYTQHHHPPSLSSLSSSTPAVLAVAAAAASFVPQRRQVGFLLHLHMTHTHTARQLSPRSDPKRGCTKKMSKSSWGEAWRGRGSCWGKNRNVVNS